MSGIDRKSLKRRGSRDVGAETWEQRRGSEERNDDDTKAQVAAGDTLCSLLR